MYANDVGTGCFVSSIGTGPNGSGSVGYIEVQNDFNASNSNSIYTDSGKVYPLSLALNFIIKS